MGIPESIYYSSCLFISEASDLTFQKTLTKQRDFSTQNVLGIAIKDRFEEGIKI